MQPTRRPRVETTCSARAVDAGLRGAVLGSLWGMTTSSRRQMVRKVARNAFDFSAFLSIYSGMYCALQRERGDVKAGAMAGATAGSFVCLTSRTSPRVFAFTTLGCAVFGVVGGIYRDIVE